MELPTDYDVDLRIPENEKGYLSVLKAFRTLVPVASRRSYYFLEHHAEGRLPQEILDELPLFGSYERFGESRHVYNSGGRGFLLSDGESHLRFKGADIDGTLTNTVAFSKRNQCRDVVDAVASCESMNLESSRLRKCGSMTLPTYSGKPFSFFTKEAIERERAASERINEYYQKDGFNSPYSFAASIEYPGLTWQGKPCSTMVFGLPSLESDLRYQEFQRLAFLHLKFASPDELQSIKDKLGSFSKRLMSWYGYSVGSMEYSKLAPTPPSHQHQNYVLFHASSDKIGSSRVDHSSTVRNRMASIQFSKGSRSELFFCETQLPLLHALELAEEGFRLDEDQYTGIFDAAFKWPGQVDYMQMKETSNFVKDAMRSLNRGYIYREPEPIPESEFKCLLRQIYDIKIDPERQARVTANQRRALERLMKSL